MWGIMQKEVSISLEKVNLIIVYKINWSGKVTLGTLSTLK
jgi:hypothetical protein